MILKMPRWGMAQNRLGTTVLHSQKRLVGANLILGQY